MQRILSILIIILFIAASVVLATDLKYTTVDMPKDQENFRGWAPNRIVVKFDKSITNNIDQTTAVQEGKTGINALDQIAERYGVVSVLQKYPNAEPKMYKGRVIDLRGWHKVSFASKVDVEKVVQAYKDVPGVIDAQPVGIHAVYATPNDGHYPDQYHLNQSNDHDMDAPEAWDLETGDQSVIVAILDTGVRYFHKDLGGSDASYNNPENSDGNMWLNTDEDPNNGIDDDGNGYVDDWIGWDFVDGESVYNGEDGNTPDNDPRDFNGHGTHCAGNVAAINNNNYATASPSGGWNDGSNHPTANGVKVMALRIGWSWGFGPYELGYVGMDYAADAFYYAADNGAKIASCSWGSSNSGGLGDAADYFLASGGIIFKAAGNDNNETSDYLNDLDGAVSVAATDQNDCKSDFSSYGTWVEISAPGTDIVSLYHNHEDPENDYIATMSGTSMATPLAAGSAALIWSHNPGWTADQVRQQLYDTADDIYAESCNSNYDGKLGAGRVNLYNAVNTGGGPAAPVADFSGSPTSGCAPLTVNFTDASTGQINSWSWDFGDGGTSTAQNPSHEYTTAGTYTVSLTVTGDGGSDTETKVDYITVNGPPTAAFSGSPTSGVEPLTVTFTDASTGDPTSWSWDFGDGGTSTAQNPTHEYTAAGTYTVTLTATNDCGSDDEVKTDYITVDPCNAPVAAFSGTPTSGDAPLTVNFTDESTNSPTSWSWNFGDGSTSTEQNPSHTYNNAGTYTVTLDVSNSCGSDTETKTDYINVTCTAPVAAFTGSPTSGDAPLTVSFTDQSTNNPTSWSWDFGDGSTSTEQNPSHTYNDAGTYTVSLDVSNSCGSDNETKTDYITVNPPQQNMMHVDAITVTKESWYVLYRGKAEIRIVDSGGSPVADATVSGDWSGGASNSDGIAIAYSNWKWGDDTFEFCVTNVTKSGWTYDEAANVETCDDSQGSEATLAKENIDLKEIEKQIGRQLAYNYPNPFNPTTTISFYLPEAGHVTVDIYNVLGKKIATLVDNKAEAGLQNVVWNATDDLGQKVGSGYYFFQITINKKETLTRKMLLLK